MTYNEELLEKFLAESLNKEFTKLKKEIDFLFTESVDFKSSDSEEQEKNNIKYMDTSNKNIHHLIITAKGVSIDKCLAIFKYKIFSEINALIKNDFNHTIFWRIPININAYGDNFIDHESKSEIGIRCRIYITLNFCL